MMTRPDYDGPPLCGFEWNEADPFPDGCRELIATITCLTPGSFKPVQIGSGFILQGRGNRGIVVTAAHVISEGVRTFQNPRRAHRTALPEFLPPADVSAATPALRVVVQNGDRVELCRVAYVLWDEPADLAILAVVTQDDAPIDDLFFWRMKLAADDPKVGDVVATMGFAEFHTEAEDDGPWRGSFSRRAVLRVGKVTAFHPEGTLIHRSPCIDASMPTFSGMSGGPAFLYRDEAEPLVFGLLSASEGSSSDPTEPDPDAMDRSKAGRTTFRLLPRTITPLHAGAQMADLHFVLSGKAINEEIDPDLFSGDMGWLPM